MIAYATVILHPTPDGIGPKATAIGYGRSKN